MNNLNDIDQKVERALECVTLTQDVKYRVKNKIHSASSHVQKHTGRKLSSAAVIAVTLVSLLVITGAAVGISMFNAVYGEKADVLTPYGTAINTVAQNDDIVLTLHESVADEYATAYIFSVKGLTDAGKALVENNTLDPNAYETAFVQTNGAKYVWPDNKFHDEQGNYIKPTVSPPEITDCKIYSLQQKNASGNYVNYNIALRYDGVTYDTIVNTANTIIPIQSLREENREYYALYVITPETHQITLTFDGLELPLPEAKTQIPGTEVIFDGYIQDYFLTEEGMSKIMSDYPTSAVLTPLGLYVNDNNTRSLMYKTATLVFNDGSEQELSGISNEKTCIVSWKPNYFPSSYQGAVYLFNEIMDISTVKSMLFYNEIEFPFDGSAPFVRSSGRVLSKKNAKVLLWDIAEKIHDYVVETCPDPWTVTDPDTKESSLETGWSDVQYMGRAYEIICFTRSSDDDRSYFVLSLSDAIGGTLEEEILAKTESEKLNVLAKGTYEGVNYMAVNFGTPQWDNYQCGIYALYEGKLYCIEYHSTPGQPTNYAFDALLELIK